MPQQNTFCDLFTEGGRLVGRAVAGELLVGLVGPASAQFFNFGGPPQRPQPPQPRSNGGGFGGGGWFGGDLFAPFQQQAPKRVIQDFSKAPPPDKRETLPDPNVLGPPDRLPDWLPHRPAA